MEERRGGADPRRGGRVGGARAHLVAILGVVGELLAAAAAAPAAGGALAVGVGGVRLHLGAEQPVLSDEPREPHLHLHVAGQHAPVLLPFEEVGGTWTGGEHREPSGRQGVRGSQDTNSDAPPAFKQRLLLAQRSRTARSHTVSGCFYDAGAVHERSPLHAHTLRMFGLQVPTLFDNGWRGSDRVTSTPLTRL